jgi:hypothetical protein
MCLQGGGAFAVVPLAERGKLPDLIPLFKGHSAPVLDTDFNPFNDSVLASASEDSKVCMRLGLYSVLSINLRFAYGLFRPISLFWRKGRPTYPRLQS